jgi:hypothetical protein
MLKYCIHQATIECCYLRFCTILTIHDLEHCTVQVLPCLGTFVIVGANLQGLGGGGGGGDGITPLPKREGPIRRAPPRPPCVHVHAQRQDSPRAYRVAPSTPCDASLRDPTGSVAMHPLSVT